MLEIVPTVFVIELSAPKSWTLPPLYDDVADIPFPLSSAFRLAFACPDGTIAFPWTSTAPSIIPLFLISPILLSAFNVLLEL